METQNRRTTFHVPETAAEKAIGLVLATVEKLIKEGQSWPALERQIVSDQIASVIRAELNTDINRELPVRMTDRSRKRAMLRQDVTDEEIAYPVAPANSENFIQWEGTYRDTLETSLRTTVVWAVATLAILGFLTAMLIAGIAISV